MKDYSDLSAFNDKKLRTLRNNLNNRLSGFKQATVKALATSHMLHGLDEGQCNELLKRVQSEMRTRAKA